MFGAEGEEFDELRDLLPPWVELGSFLMLTPVPEVDLLGLAPWGRFKRYRRRYDAVIARMIAKARADGHLEQRGDVLALLLRSTYDDGTSMSDSEVADELLTLLVAGHETTATTLSWAVERLRRHPEVLTDLAAEVDAGGSDLRRAVITEVQRCRPVIDLVFRQVMVDGASVGPWTLPKGMTVIASILEVHRDAALFPDPLAFRPDRFLGTRVDTQAWIPFGGGVRRCIGAAFAQLEMDVVLRTLLREFTIEPTTALDEDWHSRGVAWAPRQGGRVLVRRR